MYPATELPCATDASVITLRKITARLALRPSQLAVQTSLRTEIYTNSGFILHLYVTAYLTADDFGVVPDLKD